jgi:hypothetical protein
MPNSAAERLDRLPIPVFCRGPLWLIGAGMFDSFDIHLAGRLAVDRGHLDHGI